jgi:rubrerythrin
MDVREKLVELLKASFYDEYEFEEVADHLIAHGVTVQERVRQYWDVCNNNSHIQYRCPHCETVYVYMYKNHIAPDVCKECGARLYLPQPPKGE